MTGSRGLVSVCSLAALLFAGQARIVAAEEHTDAVMVTVEEPRFSAAIEAKLKDVIPKLLAGKKEQWSRRVHEEIEEIRKVTGLSEAEAQSLVGPGDAAIEKCLQGWPARAELLLRRLYVTADERYIESTLTYFASNAGAGADLRFTIDLVHPWESPDWTDALTRTLNPAQLAVWRAATKLKDLQLKAAIPGMAKQWFEIQEPRPSASAPLMAFAQEAARELSLAPEAVKKLNSLVTAACEERRQAVLEFIEKTVRSDDRPNLQQFSAESWDLLRMEKIPAVPVLWERSLQGALPPEVVQGIKAIAQERRQRQAQALADLFVAAMDVKVALTSRQREALLPIALRLVQQFPALWKTDDSMTRQLFVQPFYRMAASVTPSENEHILDAAQLSRWVATAHPKITTAVPPAIRPVADTRPREPEEVETQLSGLCYQAAEERRAAFLSEMTLTAEDLIRNSAPTPKQAAQLFAAARGTVERRMESWKSELEERARAVLAEQPAYTPEDIFRTQFRYWQGSAGEPLQKISPWKDTVETGLSPRQRASWQKEIDERRTFALKTNATVILVLFDLSHPVTPEQFSALEPLVGKFLAEYGPIMGVVPEGPAWQLFTRNSFVPFKALEGELKSILTKEQWVEWAESEDQVAAQQGWQRVKAQKEGPARAVIRG